MKSLNRPMFNMGGRVNRVGMAAGGNTITSMLANGVQNAMGNGQRGWSLVILSIATSIDALAVGLTLAMLGNQIFIPALTIGLVCAILTASCLNSAVRFVPIVVLLLRIMRG